MKLTQGPIAEWLKPWVSLWLTIHLFALVVCLAANRTTSELGRRLVRLLAPHSVVLHQDYGGIALGMTHGDPVDQQHHLELHFASAAEGKSDEWVEANAGFISVNLLAIDRRWKNFQQMLAVAADEKNEEIVHLCFDYVLRQVAEETRNQIDRVRLVRSPTLSLATHTAVQRGELPESELAAITLFECAVVKLSGDRIKLVPVLEKTRRSKSLRSLGVPPGNNANPGEIDANPGETPRLPGATDGQK